MTRPQTLFRVKWDWYNFIHIFFSGSLYVQHTVHNKYDKLMLWQRLNMRQPVTNSSLNTTQIHISNQRWRQHRRQASYSWNERIKMTLHALHDQPPSRLPSTIRSLFVLKYMFLLLVQCNKCNSKQWNNATWFNVNLRKQNVIYIVISHDEIALHISSVLSSILSTAIFSWLVWHTRSFFSFITTCRESMSSFNCKSTLE